MARQVNLVRSKVRQRMLTRLAESSGRPLECHGNVSPREMAVEGAKNPGTEPGVQVGPFASSGRIRQRSDGSSARPKMRDDSPKVRDAFPRNAIRPGHWGVRAGSL